MRTLVLTALALGLASLGFAQSTDNEKLQKKSVALPLGVEKGREYDFRVEMEGRQQQAGQESRENQPGQPAQEPGQQAGRPGFDVSPTGGTNFDYHFVTQDVKPNEYTFQATLNQSQTQLKEEGKSAPAGQSSQSSAQGSSPVTFTFTLDQNANITKLNGLQQLPNQPFATNMITSHLHLIFGAGLHQGKLEPGKSYGPGAALGAQAQGQQNQAQSLPQGTAVLDVVQMRFDGTTTKGGKELAKFTLFQGQLPGTSPAQPSQTPQSGVRPIAFDQAADQKAGRETQRHERGPGTIGRAGYVVRDGILERLEVQGRFVSTQPGSEGLWLSIKRLEPWNAPKEKTPSTKQPAGSTR